MRGLKAPRPIDDARPVNRAPHSGARRERTPRAGRIGSYEDFWPYYLEAHGRPMNRALHYAGTAESLAFLLAFLVVGDPWLLPGFVFGGYAFAWAGHALVEGNRPATFRYPLWSLVSDARMCGLALTGRLGRELARVRAVRPEQSM